MNKFERYKRNLEIGGLTQEQQEKLFNSRVLVMGVGGLGSGVVMNLAALGVGQIKIVDYDVVKETDFNRQLIHKYKNLSRAKVISAKEWVQEYNPDVRVEIDKIEINDLNYLNVIEGYDIIVDCFDSYEAKYMLNEIILRHRKILIHGGVQGYCGQVTTIVPTKTGCLACVIQKPERFDEKSVATLSPVVSVISAIQAQEAMKVIIGEGDLLMNKLLMYDGLKGEFRVLGYSQNPACEMCSTQVLF